MYVYERLNLFKMHNFSMFYTTTKLLYAVEGNPQIRQSKFCTHCNLHTKLHVSHYVFQCLQYARGREYRACRKTPFCTLAVLQNGKQR